MLKHLLNTAIRNLFRNKLFTSINVLGLSISTAVFLALISYVQYHFSFDKFYEEGNRIYRLNYFEYQEGEPVLQTSRSHNRAALVAADYVPEIEAATRIYHEKAYIWNENTKIVDQDMLFVDSSFCKVFKLNLISGSAETSLVPPNAVMLSKSQAQVYFGKEDPIGKTIFFNERLPITVTGVFDDIPANSSVDFDFLISWATIYYYGWGSREGDFKRPSVFTFVKLKQPDADITSINTRLTSMVTENMPDLKMRGHTARYELRPYEELHTSSPLSGEIKPGISKTLLYALLSLAIFILVTAWINYVNLSLARSIDRAGEIGVRKVFGASRWIISGQFLIEALIVSSITFILGYSLYFLATGPFTGVILSSADLLPAHITGLPVYFAAFILITTLVSFYPPHFISKYKPVLILKNKLGGGKGANILHQSLMIFQLFLAITILSVAIIAERQISFMLEFDAGFNSQQTVALRGPASANSDSLRYSRFTGFRNEVLQNAAFASGTASMNIPGEEIRFHDEGIYAVGSKNDKKQSFSIMWVDEGYQETFGMKLIGGRNFNQTEKGDVCLINETAAYDLGYERPEDAVNTAIITSEGRTVTVAGVWKDYHHESVHKPVNPVIFYHRHPFEYGYYSFKVETSQKEFLQNLERIWDKHYPNDQFVYYFMDRFFAEQYRSDQLFSSLLNLFSIISVMVACLGLFGIASLAMVKRTKEIGIRKVLGASVVNILVMLSKRYVLLIALSCLFAFPLAYYLTSKWLSDFSYKISITWWMIILPGVIVLAGTMLTISIQSVRAALANPVNSLKEP